MVDNLEYKGSCPGDGRGLGSLSRESKSFAWLTTREHVLPRARAALKLLFRFLLPQVRISISLSRGEDMAQENLCRTWMGVIGHEFEFF